MGDSFLKDNKGYAMVITLIALLVLGVLSTAILSATTSNLKSSFVEREFQSSYYIAETGVVYVAEELKKDIMDIYNATSSETEFFTALEISYCYGPRILDASVFDAQYASIPKAEVSLQRMNPSETNPRTYALVSCGTVDEITRTVMKTFSLEWKPDASLGDLISVYALGNIEISNGEIVGPIGTNGDINISGWPKIEDYYLTSGGSLTSENTEWSEPHNNRVKSKIELPAPKSYELPPFPSFPNETDCDVQPAVSNSNTDNARIINLTNALTYIPNINIESDAKVIIQLNDMNHKLLINDITIPQGKIELQGNGTLKVYLRNNISLGAGSVINPPASNQEEDIKEAVERLAFYIKGTEDPSTYKSIVLSGSQKIYGSLYAEDGNIDITAGSGFQGNIVTGGASVKFSEGTSTITQMVFAPDATVEMSGRGTVYGPIVANTFKMSGGAYVEYNPAEGITYDPFFNEPTLDDLIQSESTIREK